MLQSIIQPVGEETVRPSSSTSSSFSPPDRCSPLLSSSSSSSSSPVRCAAVYSRFVSVEGLSGYSGVEETALTLPALRQLMEGEEEGGVLRECCGFELSAPPLSVRVLQELRVPGESPRLVSEKTEQKADCLLR